MAEPVALAALIVEAAVGWPDRLYRHVGHPVGGFARVIGVCERLGNRPDWSNAARRAAGSATVALLLFVAIAPALLVQRLAGQALGRWSWIVVAALAVPGLAQRSLHDHVVAVARPLAAGDLPAARRMVGRIVGRDTRALNPAGIARAAIESLAESFSDGIVAPVFWLVLAGLPGLWAYKAINTADSLIGHREPRWRAFGWAAARTDDALNFLPARLAGALLCLSGSGGWKTMRRDARRHASPNSGWPEAAMAGVLDLRLAGPIAYDGVTQIKPWIGTGRAEARPADVDHAIQVYQRACLLLWLIAGAVAWVR